MPTISHVGQGGIRRRRRGVWAVALVMALAVASCGDDDDSSSATADQSTTAAGQTAELTDVRLAYAQGFGSLPVHVAQTQGFFEEQGLSVEETVGLDMPLWIQALDAQYDIVLGIPSITMGALVAGIDHVVVSGLVRTTDDAPAIPLMTADEDIQSFADLAGKRVGVSDLSGTIAESILFLVDRAGLDANDVTLVPTPFPTMQDQLEAGQIDAATLAVPFDAALSLVGGYRVIGDPIVAAAEELTGEADALNAYFASSRSYAEANPEVVAGFRAALEDATDWILANDDAARALLAEWLGVPTEVTDIATLPMFSTDISSEDFDVFYTVAQERGSLTGEPDLANVVWQH